MAKEEEKKEEKKQEGPDLSQLTAAIVTMANSLKELKADTDKRFKELSAPPRKETKKEEPKDVDLETMTRKELMSTIIGEVKKWAQEEVIQPRENEANANRERQAIADTKEQIKQAKQDHEDFDEWIDEIKEVIEAQPGLDIESAYVVARTKNKDKASQLDAAAAEKAKEAQKKEEEKKEKELAKDFGGLLPTSTLTHNSEGLKPQEAAEAAAEEVNLDAALRQVAGG